MISRKALLINAPGDDGRGLPQINSELEETRNFLLSARGGAWKPEEILVLSNPTLQKLASTVKKMNADYTITYFSGKGFPDKNGNHFLIVEDDNFFQDTELLNSSAKQVVIIDDCGQSLSADKMQTVSEPSDLAIARKMYDRWIVNCEAGQMIMHATELPTVSATRAKGGIFTRKLLEVARALPSAEDRFNLKSILATGHATPDLLLEEGFEEGPAITWSQGNIKLPFAMALPAPAKSLLPVIRKDDFSSGLTLGIFLLAFFLSLD